jgi:putative ABC transport system permease protein
MISTLSSAFLEVKVAIRMLASRPGYAAVAALTLALGIGANVAMFTVVNAVLIRPLPYPDSDRVVEIIHHAPGLSMPDLQSAPGLIVKYRDSVRTLSHMAGYDIELLNLTGSGVPERVRGVAVTPGIFDVLQVRPAIGRAFLDADVQERSPAVAILTHAYWQSRFGSDPAVVGRTLQLDGRVTEIVGVMPRGFLFPERETRILVPLPLDPAAGFGSFGTESLGRLAPGVTLEAAQREFDQLQARIPEWFPAITSDVLSGFGWGVTVAPFKDRMVKDVARTLWLLLGAVVLVLLVAAANVANLFLVRAESRQREVAVRSALGATRGRIVGTFLAESCVLAVMGGVVGMIIAAMGTRLLVAYGPARLPRLHEIEMDTTVVAFAAGLSVLCALVLGMLPAFGSARRSLALVIREGSRGSTAGRGRHRARQGLIVAQVAMALVLLVGSSLMLRSAMRLHAVDPGFRPDGLLTVGISLGAQEDRQRAVTFYHQVLDEMARLPGVEAIGAASTLPVAATSMTGSSFEIKARPRPESAVPPFTMHSGVTAGYFETLGVPLIQGRMPERTDAEQARAVAWVNKTFARQFLDDRAVGESIQLQEVWLDIVGVVGDLHTSGLDEAPRPMVYVPAGNAAGALDTMYAVIRTSGAPSSLAGSLRAAVDRVDPTVPLATPRTMAEIIDLSLAQASFTVMLLAIAAGVALVLGVVGLYGVISYIVAQRTMEIGVRLALGADPAAVRRMVLRQGITVAAAGVVVGLGLAWVSTQLLSSVLFEVSARDPLIFATVPIVLIVVSALAVDLPARRAARLDPLLALRESTG